MTDYTGPYTIPKSSPTTEELIERHSAHLPSYKPFLTIAEMQKAGIMPPKTVIITCIDPRIFPETIFNITMGEVFIFRTIAGHPQPIFEQLIGLDRTSYGFKDVILLYHTDCGAQYFNDALIRKELLETDPSVANKVEEMDFGTMKKGVEESLKEDMAWLKSQPLMRQGLRAAVRGLMYDIKTGEVKEVK